MKKINTLILPIAFLFLIAGCAKDEPKGVSDAELVQAIIDADGKVEVTMEELPTAARGTMEVSYLVCVPRPLGLSCAHDCCHDIQACPLLQVLCREF